MKNIITSILLAILAFGQTNAQYDFTTFDESDGLPDKTCRGLAVDDSGTLWIGTQEGLAKWDGTNFTAVPVEDGVTSPFVNVVKIDPDGNIWIGYLNVGSEAGLSVIDTEGNLLLHADSLLRGEPGTWVNDIEFGPDGLTYVAIGEGIAIYDGIDWSLETPTAANFSAAPVWDIEFAPNGSMWVGTFFGLAHLQANGQWEHFFTLNTDLIDDDVRMLTFGSDGRLWIGTHGGLSIFDGQNFENYWITEGLPNEFVRDIAFDEMGRAWLMTNDGFSIFDGEQFQNFETYEHPSIENKIENVVIHPTVGIWLATGQGLVSVQESVSAIGDPYAFELGMLDVFPVPANGFVRVRWEAELQGELQALSLISPHGKLLQRLSIEAGQSETQLDLTNLSAGQYWLRFETREGVFAKMLSKI